MGSKRICFLLSVHGQVISSPMQELPLMIYRPSYFIMSTLRFGQHEYIFNIINDYYVELEVDALKGNKQIQVPLCRGGEGNKSQICLKSIL